MNCLNKRSGRGEIHLVEPSAPPYYSPQPPYNPDFIHHYAAYEASLDPSESLAFSITESYAGTAYEGDDECDRWGRRSLYEGVNCMPVSAPACVRRAARCPVALTHCRAASISDTYTFLCCVCYLLYCVI